MSYKLGFHALSSDNTITSSAGPTMPAIDFDFSIIVLFWCVAGQSGAPCSSALYGLQAHIQEEGRAGDKNSIFTAIPGMDRRFKAGPAHWL